MKVLLTTSGFSLKEFNQLTMSEVNDYWIGLHHGLWGFTKDYLLAYNTQLFIHNMNETTIALNSSKRYKPKPFPKISRIYPQFEYFLNGGKDSSDVHEINNKFKNFFRLHGSKV